MIPGRRTKAAFADRLARFGANARWLPVLGGSFSTAQQSATRSAVALTESQANEVWWSLASMRGTTLQEMV